MGNQYASSVYCDASTSGPVVMPQLDYNIENPVYPLDDPSVYSEGITSNAGLNVGGEKPLQIPAVWQAINRISGDVAKLPLHLYKRGPDDTRERAAKHPAYKLVRRRPNRESDAFKFWRRAMVALLYWNNSYIFVARDPMGRPAELLPLLPDRTVPHRKDGRLFYVTEVEAELIPIPAEDVIHLEGLCLDGLAGADLMKHARNTWGLNLAALNMASKFFANGARTGGILEVPSSVTKKSADNLEDGFRKRYEGAQEAFKTVILRDGAKFHAAQATMRETQGVEARSENVRDVARYFNIRPGHLGEESNVSYGSKYEDNRDYHDTTLSPHLVGITSQCGHVLLTDEEGEEFYFEHNVDRLLMMDPLQSAQKDQILVAGEILTPNEARRARNLPPMDGGNELRNPNTNTREEVAAAASEEQEDAVNALADRTVRKIVDVIAARGQRAAATPEKFEAWNGEGAEKDEATLRDELRPVFSCRGRGPAEAEEEARKHAAAVMGAIREELRVSSALYFGDRHEAVEMAFKNLKLPTIGG